jgi:hypothetical protein
LAGIKIPSHPTNKLDTNWASVRTLFRPTKAGCHNHYNHIQLRWLLLIINFQCILSVLPKHLFFRQKCCIVICRSNCSRAGLPAAPPITIQLLVPHVLTNLIFFIPTEAFVYVRLQQSKAFKMAFTSYLLYSAGKSHYLANNFCTPLFEIYAR